MPAKIRIYMCVYKHNSGQLDKQIGMLWMIRLKSSKIAVRKERKNLKISKKTRLIVVSVQGLHF